VTADEYRWAAYENLRAAENADQGSHFVAGHYLAGLAVECILRAYRWRINEAWEGRHNLPRLAEEAEYFNLVSRRYRSRFASQFNDLVRRWRNDHRFYSSSKLETYLTRIRIASSTQSRLAENSKEMVELA